MSIFKSKPKTMTWQVPGGRVQRLSEAVFSAEHTLIAGTTGSGKSVLLNGIVRDFLRTHAPGEGSLVLIDPKQMELSEFSYLPHCIGYADTEDGAERLLMAVQAKMAERNRYCKERRIREYPGGDIYIIIDELLPLTTGSRKATINRLLSTILTQARAARIHVIAATQLPNRASVPANIVSLFTLRIGLRMVSSIESRQTIGVKGCESLPLHGTALVLRGPVLSAVNIPMTDRREVAELVSFWERQARTA